MPPEETTNQAPAAPAAGAPPAAPPSPAVEKPNPPEEPRYLAERLERERRSTLKQLGFKPDKDVPAQKQIDDAGKTIDEIKKSRKEERKAREAAESKAAALEKQVGALKTYADLELSALTPEQQAKIKSVAGDDPAEQLKVLGLLKPTFAHASPASAPPAPDKKDAVAPPPAPPATTAPAAAPAPTTTSASLPLTEQWQQVKAIADPNRQAISRVQFLLANGEELLTALTRK